MTGAKEQGHIPTTRLSKGTSDRPSRIDYQGGIDPLRGHDSGVRKHGGCEADQDVAEGELGGGDGVAAGRVHHQHTCGQTMQPVDDLLANMALEAPKNISGTIVFISNI
jgi:hypothetical protein